MAIAAIWTLLAVLGGAVAHDLGYGGGVRRALNSVRTLPDRMAARSSVETELPEIELLLEGGALRRLQDHRDRALGAGPFLFASEEDEVDVVVRVADGTEAQGTIRLKGDGTAHLRGSKWSYRVETKGDQTVFGMARFSLHHPRERNYAWEWLLHRALRAEGLIALRYDFVRVRINGENLGIYALEEHFDKRLVENNSRREAPIVRFNERLMWEERDEFRFTAAELAAGTASSIGSGNYRAAEVDAFRANKALEDPTLRPQLAAASGLLNDLRYGLIPPSSGFHAERNGRYLAVVDLLGANHSAIWHNQRFYYDPISGQIEPIGFDGDAGLPTHQLLGDGTAQCWDDQGLALDCPADRYPPRLALLSDPHIFREYIAALERISKEDWWNDFMQQQGEELDEVLTQLRTEFSDWEYDPTVVPRNASNIRRILESDVQAIHAYRADDGVIRVANRRTLPMEIVRVTQAGTELQTAGLPMVLQPRPAALSYVSLPIADDLGLAEEPRIHYRILGGSDELLREAPLAPAGYEYEPTPANWGTVALEDDVAFPFLRVDEEDNVAEILPGDWRVERPVVLPDGMALFAGPATRLQLAEDVFILVRGQLQFLGTESAPVVLEGDGIRTGIAVVAPSTGSRVEWTEFRSLGAPIRGPWRPTGAVTFYEAPVDLRNVGFANSRGEDALNIVRAEFTLDGVRFEQTAFDALDVDFGQGSLDHTSFAQIGNDAIDFSGSLVEVRDIRVRQAGDKAISVGEASRVIVSAADLRGAFVGIAVKDGSEGIFSATVMGDVEHPVAVYKKKPEYGPPLVRLGADMDLAESDLLIEQGSSAELGSLLIQGSAVDLFITLYPEG